MYRASFVGGLIIGSVLAAGGSSVRAQEWSPEQRAVWETLTALTASLDEGDLEATMRHFHDDFSGWGTDAPLPVDKQGRRALIADSIATRRTTDLVFSSQTPVAIEVHGNVAVVHSYLSRVVRDKKSRETTTRHIRWTDVLLREADRWVLIADHGRLWKES
jgi:ketosteroid isomerase-like protein